MSDIASVINYLISQVCCSEFMISYKQFSAIEARLIAGINVDSILTSWVLTVRLSYVSPGGRSQNFNVV